MIRLQITLNGSLIHGAHRTFSIQVPDDADVELMSTDTLCELADAAKVPWSFSDSGYLQTDSHEIESITDVIDEPTEPSVNMVPK